MRVAVIRNPLSRLNAKGRGRPLPLPSAEPQGADELRRALLDFRADGTGVVVVDGGDGTVREVLTVLVELGWFPRLAVVPKGTVNLIARDVGFRPPRRQMVERLGFGGSEIRRRHLLRLDHAGGTSYGMFLGGAGFRLAWELANRHLHPRGLGSGAAVIAALALMLGQTNADGPLAAGEAMGLRLDGGEAAEGRRFLLLATTLDRLMMGLWPFWGGGEGGLRLLDVAAPPRRLAAALPALARGRPRPWMAEAGYRSARAQRVELRVSSPVILDGEPFAPTPDGRLVLSLGPEMDFILS